MGVTREDAAAAALSIFVSYARTDEPIVDRLVADLESVGHRCWRDTSDIRGGEAWLDAIAAGIERADALVTVVSEAANASRFVRLEYLHACELEKPVIPARGSDCRLPWYMADQQALDLFTRYEDGRDRLVSELAAIAPSTTVASGGLGRREGEIQYLHRLQLQKLQHTELYTPLAGVARTMSGPASRARRIRTVVAHQEFDVLLGPLIRAPERHADPQARRFDDVTEAVLETGSAVILGEPGAGKTTSLFKIADDAVRAALVDRRAPVPLLARLGEWTESGESFSAFLKRTARGLAEHLDALLDESRVLLLLDGLNETPIGMRDDKAGEVRTVIEARPGCRVVVTCRGLDYRDGLDLGLATITIRPLDPPRVREFLATYVTASGAPESHDRAAAEARADDLFWALAGGEVVRETWAAWESAGADLSLFFSADDIPRENPGVYSSTTLKQDQVWRETVRDPRNLIRLAENPYMLCMLVQIHAATGEIPPNRAALFERFVAVLMLREGLAEPDERTSGVSYTLLASGLLSGLERVAWAMQTTRRGPAGAPEAHDRQPDSTQARTALERAAALEFLGESELRLAAGASLVSVTEREVRFAHQLLQEHFVAKAMRFRLERGELLAGELWPQAEWWRPSGWEEAAVLLAGLYDDDCTPVLEWLMETNPEAAARCARRSGAPVPDATLVRLREAWVPRLTDCEREPASEARAAVGRALGSLELHGVPLDNRPGVGLRLDTEREVWLPDIDWVAIPAGQFVYQKGERRRLPAFFMARFPVTNAQFRCFIDHPQGYHHDAWWQGLAERPAAPAEPRFDQANHPRETVSWFESVAYSRWLSDVSDTDVRLPTDEEWERAARGAGGSEYPWGDGYRVGFANINESWADDGTHNLGLTTAVGMYPQGASPEGVLDMAGNVWEWCLNEYETPANIELEGQAARVLRGGSWYLNRDDARAVARYVNDPVSRYGSIGFRLLCSSPIS